MPIAAVREGDALPYDFEALFQEHCQLVFRTAYAITGHRQDAEDVLQSVFVKVLQRGLTPEVRQQPARYLHRAAVNASLNALRSRKRRRLVDGLDVQQIPESRADVPADQQASAQAASPRPPAKAQFEEASIRPCTRKDSPSGGRGGANISIFRMTPGRLYAECVTVGWMIYGAYYFSDAQGPADETPDGAVANLGDGSLEPVVTPRVRGGPRWVHEDQYTVEAVADPTVSAVTLQKAMMWDLLERRLQLKVHPEADHVRALDLTVAAGGLRIKPMADGETCVTDPSRSRLPEGLRNPENEGPRCPIAMKSGWVDGGPNYRWELSIGMRPFVAIIRSTQGNQVFGPRVNDKTGIPGDQILNVALEFGPDQTTPVLLDQCAKLRERFPRCGALPSAPPLAIVLERDLGLKFEPTTRPREFVVIDHIARPMSN